MRSKKLEEKEKEVTVRYTFNLTVEDRQLLEAVARDMGVLPSVALRLMIREKADA